MDNYSDWVNSFQPGAPYNPKRARTDYAQPPGAAGSDFNPFSMHNTYGDPSSSAGFDFQSNNTHSIVVELQRFSAKWEKFFFKNIVFCVKKMYSAMSTDPTLPENQRGGKEVMGIRDMKTRATRRNLYANGQPGLYLHLPLVNYHLIKCAIEVAAGPGNPSMSVYDVLNSVSPAGVVNSNEQLVKVHSHGSTDTRVLVIQGPVDVHNIWSGSTQRIPGEEHESDVRLKVGDKLFFVIRPVFVGSAEVKQSFCFDLDGETRTIPNDELENVSYYFQIVPYFTSGNPPPKSAYEVERDGVKVKGAYWAIGMCEHGIGADYNDSRIGDPCNNYNNIVRAPLLSMMIDVAATY